MKILKIDRKNGEITAIAENTDDLWHLEKIIDKGDTIFATTDRKIKASKEGEKAQRQTIFVELKAEDAKFHEYSENLRVNGIITGGHPEEYIELKSHQSIEVKAGDKFKIKKSEIKQWQVERLKKAEESSASAKLLVILLDDEEAELAFVNQYSINRKANIKEKRRGKRFATEKSDYFDQILEKIRLLEPKKILLAGPGFTKENLKKFLDEVRDKKIPSALVESTSSIGETGFKELITQGKLEKTEKQLQIAKEGKTIEAFLASLAKGKAEYGKENILGAITNGAAEKIIIAETYLMQNRTEAEEILDSAEKNGCETEIISSRNPQEKNIIGFGGAVAILRHKTS